MKKFKFTMQAVLDVRKALRETREMELAEARAILSRESAKMVEIQKAIEAALSPEIMAKADGGSFFIQRERYMRKLRDAKKTQERKINEAIAKVKEAIIEMKKMERAKDRQYETWSLEFKREEQKQNDEIASGRAHMRILAGSYE